MKNRYLICLLLITSGAINAQTNTFPATGNVGIGTTSPTDILTVAGQIKSGAILMTGWSNSPYSNSTWLRGANGVGVFLTNENVTRWAGLQADGSFDVSSSKFFVDAATGYSGFNTKTPTHQLFVNGGSKTNSMYIGSSSNFIDRSGNGDNIYIRQPMQTSGGWWGMNVAIQGPLSGHTAPFYPVRYLSDENSDGLDDTEHFFIDKYGGGFFRGNIGLGTTNPMDKIHIDGVDAGVRIGGSIRSRMNLYTGNQNGWQIEVSDANGNQFAGDLGFTESGVAAGRLVLKKGGNIGIGLLDPTERLSVNGNVRAKKVIVTQAGWPDYVFDTSYSLRSLSEVEAFIAKNKHLPDMPSARDVEEKGISVGDNQALLLKKIEELTLYLIELKKENTDLKKRIDKLENK